MKISSSAFRDGGRIPDTFSRDKGDRSPPLKIEDVPAGTKALAVVVDDPDAPSRTWVHWTIWDIPPEQRQIPEAVPKQEVVKSLGGARQGRNDFDAVGWGGPQPPKGHGPHRYRFTAYALREPIELGPGADRDALDSAMQGRTLATARITGTYERT